jgi:hypothetical protein
MGRRRAQEHAARKYTMQPDPNTIDKTTITASEGLTFLPGPATIDLVKVPLVEPEGGRADVYSNIVNLNWTAADVRIRFMELLQASSDSEKTIAAQRAILMERAAVTMAWHQAKVLRDLLHTAVSKYEELNGEMRIPTLPSL